MKLKNIPNGYSSSITQRNLCEWQRNKSVFYEMFAIDGVMIAYLSNDSSASFTFEKIL